MSDLHPATAVGKPVHINESAWSCGGEDGKIVEYDAMRARCWGVQMIGDEIIWFSTDELTPADPPAPSASADDARERLRAAREKWLEIAGADEANWRHIVRAKEFIAALEASRNDLLTRLDAVTQERDAAIERAHTAELMWGMYQEEQEWAAQMVEKGNPKEPTDG